MEKTSRRESIPLDISEQDIIEAMKAIQGYLDITPGDFRQVYQAAYTLAIERLFNTLTAVDLMTSPVLQVDQDMNLIEAAGLLAEKQVSGAPVIDSNKKIVGVVSEKDFLGEMGVGGKPSFMQMVSHCLHNDESCMIGRLHRRSVGEIMTKPPVTGLPEMTISAISSLFVARKINRLPIIDNSGLTVGIVTRTDLAHTYSVFDEEE
ncbi:MAG: CBS domain-containing protein [Deltaproteobacteria bacterium]|nr:CBS domain-containing protein [Deltaproteobacteria bacterium]